MSSDKECSIFSNLPASLICVQIVSVAFSVSYLQYVSADCMSAVFLVSFLHHLSAVCDCSVFSGYLQHLSAACESRLLNKLPAASECRLWGQRLQWLTCICALSPSLSIKISLRFFVPIMFRKVVWASSLVEPWASETFVTETVAFWILKYTTASTVTVTLSRVRA